MSDTQCIEIVAYLIELEYILLEEVYVRKTKIRIDLLDIDTDYLSSLTNDFCYNLEETPWCARDIEHIHIFLYQIIFFMDFDELECTPSSIPELFCLCKIWIMDDKWFWHNCKEIFFDFRVNGIMMIYHLSLLESRN